LLFYEEFATGLYLVLTLLAGRN